MNRWRDWAELGKDLGQGLGNVVRLPSQRGLPQARSHIAQMEAYWSALPRHNGVPRRADVDPRGIEDVLPYAVILERVAPRVARLRIAGQHLQAITGMEVRGMPISALFAGPDRAIMADATEALFDRPALLTARLSGQAKGLKRPLAGHMILMPLSLEDGTVARAMGAIVTDAKPGSAPQSLSLSDLCFRAVGPEAAPAAPAPAMAFAEDQAPLTGAPPRLRLVHSSD